MSDPTQDKNTQARTADPGQIKSSPGPYIGRVIKHIDPYYLGGLEVELLKTTEAGNIGETLGQTTIVYYASPFYGVTNAANAGKNDTYQDTQKSYGFWAVPPDPGTLVLCTFVEGTREFGYWFGCIPEKGMTFMLPGGHGSTEQTSGPVPNNLKGKRLPVGEYNKKITKPNTNNVTKYKRPINEDYIEKLVEQGLIEDDIRGITSTSAMREFPSAVFGISSPGPLDKRGGSPTGPVGIKESRANMHTSRLGSSSFVIDDGDDKLIREGNAKEFAYKYLNKEASEPGGDVTIPHNEMIRLRTRTGAQIMMHTSEDLIYINNSSGSCWLEMTANGKLDIYAADSVSVHSENDINFTADRDINFEAGRNINMIAVQNVYQSAAMNWEVKVGVDGKITALNNIETNAAKSTNITSGTTSNINSTDGHYETAGVIHMNGPEAATATEAVKAKFAGRVPQHEPWDGHENWDPTEQTPDKQEAGDLSKDIRPENINPPTDRTPAEEL